MKVNTLFVARPNKKHLQIAKRVGDLEQNCKHEGLYATDDVRIARVQLLTPPQAVLSELPIHQKVAERVFQTREHIRRILEGTDHRLLMIVGPCSIHDARAAMEYAQWLAGVSESYRDHALILMRVHFEKPRTVGGWKGLINDPYLDGSFQINEGVKLARKLLIEINECALPTATEFLDLVTPQYIGDLISWAAIGARTTESQIHRELASGLSCPIGFKNGTQGNTDIAVNAVLSARNPHHFLSVTKSGVAAIISTRGNTDCHIILRGGPKPNYDPDSVRAAVANLQSEGLRGRVMIDCSHGNCQADFHEQLSVAECVRLQLDGDSRKIMGLMVESNLVEGKQAFSPSHSLIYGQSITDPCLGKEDTLRLLDIVFRRHRAGCDAKAARHNHR